MVLWGQGEMHLRVALERLTRKYGIEAEHAAARDPLQGDDPQGDRECAAGTRSSRAATASSATSCSTIKPLPRGAGFEFSDEITGGVVPQATTSPRSRSACATTCIHGPLGFPVVDVGVC